MPSSVVQVRMAPELLERLDRAAQAEHRSRSNLITKAVLDYVERHYPEG